MLGKRLLCRAPALKGRHPCGLGGGHLCCELLLTGVRLQLFELQFHLIEQAAAALRAGAILRSLELGDLQLQMGDQGICCRCLRTSLREVRFGFIRAFAGNFGLTDRGRDKRFKRLDVVRKRMPRSDHGLSKSSLSLWSNREMPDKSAQSRSIRR